METSAFLSIHTPSDDILNKKERFEMQSEKMDCLTAYQMKRFAGYFAHDELQLSEYVEFLLLIGGIQ